jgi:hypothetical protein
MRGAEGFTEALPKFYRSLVIFSPPPVYTLLRPQHRGLGWRREGNSIVGMRAKEKMPTQKEEHHELLASSKRQQSRLLAT